MSRFSFTSTLDHDTVKSSELDALFLQLAIWFNTPAIGEDNVEPNAVEYRHTSKPLTLELARKFSHIVGGVTFDTVFGGYYPINESKIVVDLGSVTEYANRYETDMPVGFIKAIVHQSCGTSVSPTAISNYCIGVSTDGGVTWTPLVTETRRPVGSVNGGYDGVAWSSSPTSFFNGSQKHYMTGAVGYIPKNYPMDKRIILMCSAGGWNEDVALGGERHFCVMADSNAPGHGFLKGTIEANFRWTLDTP